MNRLSIAVFFGLLLLAALGSSQSDSIRRETVFMSKDCPSGWYIDSRDGAKIVMACYDAE
jgi:hypothetical protein